MTKDYSPVSKIFYITILLAVSYFMAELSYGWSIGQTMVLTSAVTGNEYAATGAWLIQLAPQALLAVAGIALMKKQKNLAYTLIVSALVVNLLDAYTNIVAFQELWPAYSTKLLEMGRSMQFVNATNYVGNAVSFLVTWFEEFVMLCIGTAIILFVELSEEMDWRLPKFFRPFGAVTSGMGFNFSQAQSMASSSQRRGNYRSNVTISDSDDDNEHSYQPRPNRVRS